MDNFNSDAHLMEGLLHHTVKATGKMIDQGNRKDGPDFTTYVTFFLLLCSLLTFFGTAAVKIVFRKNPKLNNWDVFSFVICAVAFGSMGVWGLVAGLLINDDTKTNMNFPGFGDSCFVCGVLYLFLTGIILVKGFRSRFSKLPPDHRSILTVLANEGWSQSKIRKWGEPWLLIIIGAVGTAYNLLAGIPIIFCALSVWLHLLKDLIMGTKSQIDEFNDLNEKYGQSRNLKVVK